MSSLSTEDLQELYGYIRFLSQGRIIPTYIRRSTRDLATEIFHGRQPLPVPRDAFLEFCRVEVGSVSGIVGQPVTFSINPTYFSYVAGQRPIDLVLTRDVRVDLRARISYQSPLIPVFESFLNSVEDNSLAIFFGAGGDDPIPTTESFIEAQRARARGDLERMRWTYLDFAIRFFAPILRGGQVIAQWILNTGAEIITTNWSRSIERELIRLDATRRTYMRNRHRIISYFENLVNITPTRIEVILGDHLSPDKDRADTIVDQAEALLIFGSTLSDPNLRSWVISYRESRLEREDQRILIGIVVKDDKIRYRIPAPWTKFIENFECMLPFVRI